MAAFDDFMERFSYNPETFNETEFKSAAKAAHDEDAQIFTNAVQAKEAELTAARERITKLGSDNWDLLMKKGPPIANAPKDVIPSDTPTPRTIESFFKKKP